MTDATEWLERIHRLSRLDSAPEQSLAASGTKVGAPKDTTMFCTGSHRNHFSPTNLNRTGSTKSLGFQRGGGKRLSGISEFTNLPASLRSGWIDDTLLLVATTCIDSRKFAARCARICGRSPYGTRSDN